VKNLNQYDDKKYKDDLPVNTVSRIKQLLSDLGIFTVETNWKNSAKGFYSVSVMIPGTNISTNGKGTTAEYALASAYGEFMERLQNQSFFRLATDVSPSAFKYMGFFYAPDEKYMSAHDLLKSKDEWIRIQLSSMKNYVNWNRFVDKWKSISFEDVPSDFVTLPYLNLRTKRLSYIPVKMISKMYMSNGMCAGNTFEEAMVQGLSETFERVVNKELVINKITPPTIPMEYIARYPKLESMIKAIEDSGEYTVIVKDCSLNKKYPVVGVILINKVDQTYFIKFGSHPIFEIALERTLTELLQGQDIRQMKGVKEFSYEMPMENEYDNMIGILVNGSGYYPTNLFSDKFSYEFRGFRDFSGADNRKLLAYLLKLLSREGHDVFVRDVSYLGFPSYHIIVPKFSEIDEIDDFTSLDNYAKFVRIKKYIRNLKYLSNEEVLHLLHLMKTLRMGGPASVAQLINMLTKDVLPWYLGSIELFISAANYKIGDFKNAYHHFNKFLKNVTVNTYNKDLYTYYKCVRDYMGTRKDNLDTKQSRALLSKFYSNEIIDKVLYQFEEHNDIFNHFGTIHCWNCKNCDICNCCSYKDIEKVYKILKHQCASNPIDQRHMVKLV